MKYFFKKIEQCEMCGSLRIEHKLLGQRLNTSQGITPKRKGGISVSIYKCNNCELVFSNPQPIPECIGDHYGTPPEEYWKPDYFKSDLNYFKNQIKVVEKLIDFKKGMKALDIGAGLGKCLISLQKNGWDAMGVEPSISFFEKAISEMKIDKNILFNKSIEDIEFEDNMFDFISFGAVFEHLYSPAKVLEKTLKWLKPNGIIYIEVPSSNWLISKIFNFYFKCIGTNYVTNLSPMHVPFHLYEFNIKSFVELSNKLNFKIVKAHYDVCNIPYIPTYLHFILKFYMNKTKQGMQLTIYLQKK